MLFAVIVGDCMYMCLDWSDSDFCVIGYFTLD